MPNRALHADEEIRKFFCFWYSLDKGLTVEAQQAEANVLFEDLQKNPGVLELARTPLLATIILLIRRNEGRLPERRVELYERCCKILIENWEAHHDVAYVGVLKNLGWERHLRLLAPLAYIIQEQGTGAQAGKLAEELAQCLQAEGLCTEAARALFEAELFLRTLGVRSGLLQRLGESEYRFPHQTFQEYLVARHIAGQENPDDTVNLFMEHLHQAHWTEVHETRHRNSMFKQTRQSIRPSI